MKKQEVKLTNAKYDHWDSTFGCGPCGFGQGAIDKACARAGDVYVYYRHEHLGETTYAVYSAKGVGKITNSESIEKNERIEEYPTLAEAKKSLHGAAFTALYAFVKEKKSARKS